MQDPFNQIRKQSGWVRDNLGTQVPLGSSGDAKEMMQLPNDMRKIAPGANTLIRGKLSKELWADLAMLSTIGQNHQLTQVFVANVVAGSMAEDGQATTNFLQGIVNMLAVPALSPTYAHPQRGGDGHKTRSNHGRIAADNE